MTDIPPLSDADKITTLEQEIARLRQAQTWQPMETAPKDGTWCLVWAGYPIISQFKTRDCANIPMLEPYQWTEGSTWCRPTHWMPLPAPPKEDA